MERRLSQLDAYGIPAEFHSYEGLGHGFGLGTDTVAEGWIDDAVAFWETQIDGMSAEVSRDTPQLSLEEYRGFSVDNVLQSQEGDIHYNIYLPDSYDGSKPYALYITLPGYQGLYFQGAAQNIKTEDFGFEAQNYNEEMIILAPQLSDWGETSAKQTIALTEYFLENYNIDTSKVYISGYSGGGVTLSLVLDENSELYTAALLCSSQWDGGYTKVTETKTPVYLVIGEDDEYYSSQPFKDAYEELYKAYEDQGLSETEIRQLLVLDVKDKPYFDAGGIEYQHGGGYLFARDEAIMGWLFSK